MDVFVVVNVVVVVEPYYYIQGAHASPPTLIEGEADSGTKVVRFAL